MPHDFTKTYYLQSSWNGCDPQQWIRVKAHGMETFFLAFARADTIIQFDDTDKTGLVIKSRSSKIGEIISNDRMVLIALESTLLSDWS